MEKKLWMPLLLALLLCGCAAEAPAVEEKSAETGAPPVQTAAVFQEAPAAVEPEPEPAPEEELRGVQLEREARPITEETVLEAYRCAEEAYGWFEMAPLDSGAETVTVDGCAYSRVTARGMEDLDDLRVYLRSLFSADLTEQLLCTGGDCPLYREIDGALYVIAGGRDRDIYRGGVEVEAEQVDETSYQVSVSVELLDEDLRSVIGLECWSFPYVCEGGRWVFTDFRLVY